MLENYYLTGSIFLFVHILFTYFLGSAMTKQEGYPMRFIIGFLTLNFFVALGMIPIALLNLPWILTTVYLALMYGGLLIFIIVRFVKNKEHSFSIGSFISTQWFLFLVAFLFLAVSITYYEWIWENNCLDDGYYINAILTFPINGFKTQPSTGLPFMGFNQYLLNGYYTELSVYSYIFKIPPTVITRIYFALQHYFLFACCIQVLAKKICTWLQIECKERQYQYFALVLLLFSFSYTIAQRFHIEFFVDGWQTVTAMYYGSCVVRCLGVFLVILPFIDHEKITIKDIFFVACIGLVLNSQSTIALPAMVILPLAYLLVHWLFDVQKVVFYILAIVLLGLVGVASWYLGNTAATQEMIYSSTLESVMTVTFVGCAICFLGSFFTKNRKVIKWNVFLLLTFALMLIDPINNLFEKASVYDFVAKRNVTMVMYAFVVTSFIYFALFVYTKIFKQKKFSLIMTSFFVVLCAASFGMSHLANDGLGNAYRIMMENPEIIPQSTVDLGNVLEKKYEKSNKTNIVIMDEGSFPNGYIHSVAIILRSQTAHTICLSAGDRYGFPTEDMDIGNFNQDVEKAFYSFTQNPSDKSFEAFKKAIENIKINTIIVNNTKVDSYLQSIGYSQFDSIIDEKANVEYYVYANNVK